MLNNTTKFLALCALLSVVIQPLAAEQIRLAKMTIKLAGPNDICAKYSKRGPEFLEITHARIFEYETTLGGDHQVVSNILCTPNGPKVNDLEYEMSCTGFKKDENKRRWWIMVSVRAKKQMLSGPIEYRYQESAMQLIKNKFLDPNNLKNEKFSHDQHLYIKSFNLTGTGNLNGYYPQNDCHYYFPKQLIPDHGLYIVYGDQQRGDNYLKKIYFEPYSVGEYFSLG